MVEVKVLRMDKTVDMPSYAHDDDAAMDLRSAEDKTIPAKGKVIIKTGLKVAIPKGHAGLIWDRSGLAAKNSIHVLAGVIDAGYRGELGVVAVNLGDEDFHVEKNMRIAQMLIQPVETPDLVEVDDLDQTKRSEGGFGSTGV
jgi:dUTP pyrophosphatase